MGIWKIVNTFNLAAPPGKYLFTTLQTRMHSLNKREVCLQNVILRIPMASDYSEGTYLHPLSENKAVQVHINKFKQNI